MQTYVSFAIPERLDRAPDDEAPAQSAVLAAGFAHAAAAGSTIALCGAPVQTVTSAPWPPAAEQPACERCVEALAALVGSMPEGPGPI